MGHLFNGRVDCVDEESPFKITVYQRKKVQRFSVYVIFMQIILDCSLLSFKTQLTSSWILQSNCPLSSAVYFSVPEVRLPLENNRTSFSCARAIGISENPFTPSIEIHNV